MEALSALVAAFDKLKAGQAKETEAALLRGEAGLGGDGQQRGGEGAGEGVHGVGSCEGWWVRKEGQSAITSVIRTTLI